MESIIQTVGLILFHIFQNKQQVEEEDACPENSINWGFCRPECGLQNILKDLGAKDEGGVEEIKLHEMIFKAYDRSRRDRCTDLPGKEFCSGQV